MNKNHKKKWVSFPAFQLSSFPAVLRNSRGMTLIEVMVASAISMILVMAFYSAMDYQQKANVVQDQITKAQENIRVAMGMIERDLRMAAYGLNEQMTLTGTHRQGIYPTAGASGAPGTPDSIEIWANFNDKKLYASAAVAVGATTVSVGTDPADNTKDALSYFRVGDYLVIRDPVANKTEAKLISAVAATLITISTTSPNTAFANAYPQYSEVRDIKKHTYAVDNNGNLTLTLVVNTAGAESSPLLAENIEDLQFAYGMDNNTSSPLVATAVPDGTVDAWVNNPLGDGVDNDGNGVTDGTDARDLSRIAAVRVTIVARTAQEDKSWARAGATPPFFRPTIEDRTADGTHDGHRRRIMEKIVFVRNLGLIGKYLPH
ncbi:MAG: PilW family protein [Proteobacteria bacterium]|nr:PilW family protein [Pseudomonadota bacterium]